MLTLSCHCGEIRLVLPRRPDYINACNCSLCSKTGVRWGYFDPSEVRVAGASAVYRRADKAEPSAEFHFCARCGSTTHFTLTESVAARFGKLLGVNMQLADPHELAGIELRFPDGRSWPGAGEYGYVREARIIGDDGGLE